MRELFGVENELASIEWQQALSQAMARRGAGRPVRVGQRLRCPIFCPN